MSAQSLPQVHMNVDHMEVDLCSFGVKELIKYLLFLFC